MTSGSSTTNILRNNCVHDNFVVALWFCNLISSRFSLFSLVCLTNGFPIGVFSFHPILSSATAIILTAAVDLRLGWNYYTPIVKLFLNTVCTIIQYTDGSMFRSASTPLPNDSWIFDAASVKKDSEAIQCPDEVLTNNSTFWFLYYAEGTPNVCTASPHQTSSKQDPG